MGLITWCVQVKPETKAMRKGFVFIALAFSKFLLKIFNNYYLG